MKRLIASDIDGTLLKDGKQTLDNDFFDLINTLYAQGVLFVAASGRQLASLKMLFEPVADNIVFIAENGAYVSYKNEIIHESCMNKSLVHGIVKYILSNKKYEPIISTKDTVYLSKNFYDHFRKGNEKILYTSTITDDFFGITEDVLKITACSFDGFTKEDKMNIDETWRKYVNTTMSSSIFFDFMNPGVSKGVALKSVLKLFGLSSYDAIAFGDNFNDISMFESVDNSFVMESADDLVKQHAKFVVSDVPETIRKIYNL
ncbi:HAD family hydrolase [Howardella ureilytica]